jgi:hypothetical protein
MLHILLTFVLFFIGTIGVNAQPVPSDSGDNFRTDYQTSGTKEFEDFSKKNIERIEKNINERLGFIKKGYGELISMDDKIKSAGKVIISPFGIRYEEAEKGKTSKQLVFNYEDVPLVYERGQATNHLKQIVYEFEGNEIKSLKMIYDKKFFIEDRYNFHKVVNVDPAKVKELSVEIEYPNLYPGKKDKSEFSTFRSGLKIKTLKILENQLLDSLLKIDGLKYIATETKERRITAQLKGL